MTERLSVEQYDGGVAHADGEPDKGARQHILVTRQKHDQHETHDRFNSEYNKGCRNGNHEILNGRRVIKAERDGAAGGVDSLEHGGEEECRKKDFVNGCVLEKGPRQRKTCGR